MEALPSRSAAPLELLLRWGLGQLLHLRSGLRLPPAAAPAADHARRPAAIAMTEAPDSPLAPLLLHALVELGPELRLEIHRRVRVVPLRLPQRLLLLRLGVCVDSCNGVQGRRSARSVRAVWQASSQSRG